VKKLLSVLVLIALALAGVAWWWSAEHERAADAENYSQTSIDFGPLTEVISATGVVQPRDVYAVGSEAAGKVVAVLADFNQVVEEGEVLARLDDRVARDRLAQARLGVEMAQAGVRQAQAARDNAARLVERERNRSPELRRQTDVDLVEGNLRSADAALEGARVKVREAEEGRRQAEYALSLTEIRAPVLAHPGDASASASSPARGGVGALAPEGANPKQRRSFVVLDRKVSVNQMVGPPLSAQLFTLASDLEHVQVVAQVVEGDVVKVRRGQRARFTITGSGDADPAIEAKVTEVRLTPASDHGAVYYKAVLEAHNERDAASGEWKLRPGQTASVDVIRRSHEAVWKMPAAALNFQPDDAVLTEAARAKLQRWQVQLDHELWRAVWVTTSDHKPWPVFVRVGGKNAKGEEGIQDGQFTEVLEWDPELRPVPEPNNAAGWPRPIIGMPPPRKGWFTPPQVKL
jgi:HlyD family secretion protein